MANGAVGQRFKSVFGGLRVVYARCKSSTDMASPLHNDWHQRPFSSQQPRPQCAGIRHFWRRSDLSVPHLRRGQPRKSLMVSNPTCRGVEPVDIEDFPDWQSVSSSVGRAASFQVACRRFDSGLTLQICRCSLVWSKHATFTRTSRVRIPASTPCFTEP